MNQDDPFTNRIVDELDRSLERIDPATRSRLSQARQRALKHPGRSWTPWLAGGLATAAAGVLAAVLFLARPVSEPSATGPTTALPAPTETAVDLELLASSEDLELLAELEFYLWLEGELEEQG